MSTSLFHRISNKRPQSVKSKSVRTFIFSTLSLFAFIAMEADSSNTAPPTTKKRPLNVYSVSHEYAKNVATQFQQLYGQKVRVIPMRGSGATKSKLEYEKNKPRADVWIGGSLGAHAEAAFEGLTEAYKPASYELLKPEYRDPLGQQQVSGAYAGILCFMINKDYLASRNIPIPRSWADLAKPRYKGTITIKNPMVSGTAYTMLATVVQLMGEEKAFDYLKAFHQNVAQYGKGAVSRVYNGQNGITITFVHDIEIYEDGPTNKQLLIAFPEEGTGYEIGGISLIKNGPNSESAKKFIDLALSETLQSPKQLGLMRISSHGNVSMPKAYSFFSEYKLISYDFVWAGKHRTRLIKKWQSEVFN